MGDPIFIEVILSDVRVIRAILHVLTELIYQVVMGYILALECLFVRRVWAPVVRSCLVE
jgi:hypothetical protein